MRFARSVLSRPYLFTIIILVANFFVFLLMWRSNGMTGESMWAFSSPVLLAYGAKLNFLIDQHPHQWWRFVTPMFLHGGVIHLAVNMYSLWMIGPYVEKLYGSAKFVFFWVVTGIAGVVASYLTVVSPDTKLNVLGRFLFKTGDGPSVGASGALFGLVGVLFVFGIKFRNELPDGFKRAFGTGLLPVILLSLFIGFMGQRTVDNAAHLGGLFSGAALALVVGYRRPGEASRFTVIWRAVQVISIGVVLVSFARVAQHFNDPFPFAQAATPSAPAENSQAMIFLKFAQGMNDAQEVMLNGLRGDSSGIDSAIKSLEQLQTPDIKSDQLKRKLKDLLERTKGLAPATPSPTGKAAEQPPLTLYNEYKAWKKEYEDWLSAFPKPL
jgi:rhomboid protease GluP